MNVRRQHRWIVVLTPGILAIGYPLYAAYFTPFISYLEIVLSILLGVLFLSLWLEQRNQQTPMSARMGFYSLIGASLIYVAILSANLFSASNEQLDAISTLIKRNPQVRSFVIKHYARQRALTMLDAMRVDTYAELHGDNADSALKNFKATLVAMTATH